MRVSPAIRVQGRIAREVSGFRKPNDRSPRSKIARTGRQHACTFGTLIYPEPENELVDFKNLERAFLQ
jgi:hypothetical protein